MQRRQQKCICKKGKPGVLLLLRAVALVYAAGRQAALARPPSRPAAAAAALAPLRRSAGDRASAAPRYERHATPPNSSPSLKAGLCRDQRHSEFFLLSQLEQPVWVLATSCCWTVDRARAKPMLENERSQPSLPPHPPGPAHADKQAAAPLREPAYNQALSALSKVDVEVHSADGRQRQLKHRVPLLARQPSPFAACAVHAHVGEAPAGERRCCIVRLEAEHLDIHLQRRAGWAGQVLWGDWSTHKTTN